ncbi:MAG: DUF4010 domain-containing protein [Planctomycetota bacterium]
MDVGQAFQVLGVATGLGLLVGLQRQRGFARLAGIRTFPMITLLGAIAGLLVEELSGWIIGVAGAGVIASIIARAIEAPPDDSRDGGITTEIAIVLMFCVGVLLAIGPMVVGIVVGGTIALLLHAKTSLHDFVQRIGEQDLRAVMQFTLITLIILPVLPDETYGPFNVLNPRQIWLMVVLVVGISLAAYVGYRTLGQHSGSAVAGLLGGAISSTATTASAARRSGTRNRTLMVAAMIVVVAASVSYVRIIIEIGVVAPYHVAKLVPPLLIMLGVMATMSLAMWLVVRNGHGALPPRENPTELKPAIIFGGLYATVILAVAAAQEVFGSNGVYVVAAMSGLVNMDAITLSTSRLVSDNGMSVDDGWRVILVASMANLACKCGIVMAMGSKRLLAIVGPIMLLALLTGSSLLLFW